MCDAAAHVSNEVRRTLKYCLRNNLYWLCCTCTAIVCGTVKDGLHTNPYICVAGLYMYSNEV